MEIYVRAFARAASGYLDGPPVQVSRGGGNTPHWRADGKELFYRGFGTMMSVAVPPGTTFQPRVPQRLFQGHVGMWGQTDVVDGNRFLFAGPLEASAPQPFTVVLNWQAELKTRE